MLSNKVICPKCNNKIEKTEYNSETWTDDCTRDITTIVTHGCQHCKTTLIKRIYRSDGCYSKRSTQLFVYNKEIDKLEEGTYLVYEKTGDFLYLPPDATDEDIDKLIKEIDDKLKIELDELVKKSNDLKRILVELVNAKDPMQIKLGDLDIHLEKSEENIDEEVKGALYDILLKQSKEIDEKIYNKLQ